MGTSQSKPSASGGSPLVPSWANQDPPPSPPADKEVPPVPPSVPGEVLEPRRTTGVRRALKDYLKSGDSADGRRALGHYSRGSAGGGEGGGSSARVARAARVGGGAFSALSGAASGHLVTNNGFDLGGLAGLPVAQAVDAIVDAFCPPGIVDEDSIRAAVGEALTEALSALDQFDPTAIDDYTVVVATRTFVAELVFNAVAAEAGQAAADVTPQQAIARENDLRSLIRAVTDTHGTPIIQQAGASLTPERVASLVSEVIAVVYGVMSEW